MSTHSIGSIENYHVGFNIKQEEDKYYWFIENWEEISKEFYDTLINFNKGLLDEEETY